MPGQFLSELSAMPGSMVNFRLVLPTSWLARAYLGETSWKGADPQRSETLDGEGESA
jgi:hypothetical protein